jgi:hypothetical protein
VQIKEVKKGPRRVFELGGTRWELRELRFFYPQKK